MLGALDFAKGTGLSIQKGVIQKERRLSELEGALSRPCTTRSYLTEGDTPLWPHFYYLSEVRISDQKKKGGGEVMVSRRTTEKRRKKGKSLEEYLVPLKFYHAYQDRGTQRKNSEVL